MNYYLAIDIGASSGRHILGSLKDGKLDLEEIHRFDNGFKNENGVLVWDTEYLFNEVINGLKKCRELQKLPTTVAIDTWGVDYVLLDKQKKELFPAVSYRDKRTESAAKEVSKLIPQLQLYQRTGIQKLNFNTIYQLYDDKKSGKLDKAAYFLMIPEYLSYKLTGKIRNEYTNATTTNLVNAKLKFWDKQILDILGFPKSIFRELSRPGTEIGGFSAKMRKEIGFDAKVILCPSHDTASAVAACPTTFESAYICSGTWSLVGTENRDPILTEEAMNANFTNEGGIEYRFRFLKNIMGMWLFQSIRKDLGGSMTYDDMIELARTSDFEEKIDPTDMHFLSPDNMIEAVRDYLGKPDLPLKDVLSSVYHSIAFTYANTIKEIETVCNKQIKSINILGGGSKDTYLNELTAKYSGKKVYTGIIEGTAIGNILSQIMFDKKMSLNDARGIVKATFQAKEV